MENPADTDTSQLRFGEFVLDFDGQRLMRADEMVALSPKAFRVLDLLARHCGEAISKDRLLDEIWADVHVLEGVVKVCIAEIRKALGETGARPRFLHTVQRRGYRFDAPEPTSVDRDTTPSDSAPCSQCGMQLLPSSEFCSVCGARRDGETLAETARSPSPLRLRTEEASARSHPINEVRQLTILCCEGFDSVGGRASEQATDFEAACRTTCSAIVRSLGGRILEDDGDRVVAYFGHPRSREDDGLRALRASQRILERVPAINRRLSEGDGHEEVLLRIGIHTAPIVVGGAGDSTTPSMHAAAEGASALARASDWGTASVCARTRPLIRDGFELEERVSASDNLSESEAPSFRVVRSLEHRPDRVGASDATAQIPIVGRRQEIALVLDRWAKAREGQGQAVLIAGEAGIGKSRLVQAVREQIGDDSYGWVELHGSAYHQNSAFHPVTELLRRAFDFSPEDAPEEQVARLEMGLEQAGLPVEDLLPFFTDMLSLPLLQDMPPLQLSPELQRKRTLEAMCAWLFAAADQRPLVVFAEDLHWADPSTIEFLGLLIEHGQWYPMLIVATHRPEFVSPWVSGSVLVLPLDALGNKEVEELVAHVAGGKSVPRTVRDHIFAKGDGVPLYIEELTKTVLESDLLEESDASWERTDPIPGWTVPSTLQDSIEARLDRIGSAKELLQLAAALGREFSIVELEAVVGSADDTLEGSLDELRVAGLIVRRGVPPRVNYSFKHALIHDIAYRSLLPETRMRYHATIAQTLCAHFPERTLAAPEVIARHFEEGGLAARAIEEYERAGERAAERSADQESVAHYRRALALLMRSPAGRERDRQEIALQVAIGTPLAATRGFGSPEVQSAYSRARDLLQAGVESPRLGEVLDGLVSFYITQSQLDDASTLADQQLKLAEREKDVERLLAAHYCLGVIHYFQGDPRGALEQFARVDALYDPSAHRNLVSVRGENVGVAAAIWSAWALWIRGYPDDAVDACRVAVERATNAAHAFSLAYAHAWASVVHWNRRDRPAAIEHSEAAMLVAEEYGFPIPLGVAKLVLLRCRPDGPMTEEDLKDFEHALAELAATGTQAAVPQILAGIGEYCIERSRPEWAPGYLEGALAVSTATGQPHWDAECHRAKAALALSNDREAFAEAERLLRRAVEIAEKQHAKSLELRAAFDLARLLQSRGQGIEAKQILEPVVDWFDQKCTASDLAESRELLIELES
jgi:DNA-binding winged helix-turn-helix (wHTH) protein/class 3 adenylate cyclase/tetratricopeptide (TPR) repeat protein